MKARFLFLFMSLASIPLLAQEKVGLVESPLAIPTETRTGYTAGNKQELLSPAAAYAIEVQDISLLESLRSAGWNPSLPLGRMPDSPYNVKSTPLTLATLCEKEKSLAWLVYTCKVPPETRDNSGMRGIDWATFDVGVEERDVFGKERTINVAIVNLLKREVQPIENEALTELAYNISRKSGGRMRLYSVNGEKPGASWKGFDELLKVAQAEEKLRNIPVESRQENTKTETALKNQDSSEAQEESIDDLVVEWTRVDETTYKFDFSTSRQAMSGGGMSGRIYFKYGYWLSKIEKAWDS